MMWLMLQQDNPDDYVVATNETHSVKQFCQATFGLLGLDCAKYVKYDERYERPTEVDRLATRARNGFTSTRPDWVGNTARFETMATTYGVPPTTCS